MKMQGMSEKISTAGMRIWIRSNCTPKSLKLFRGNMEMCPCSMTLALTLQRKNKEAQVVEIYSTGRKVHVEGMKKELAGQ